MSGEQEYEVQARMTLSGVRLYIRANSRAEALEKVKRGEWDGEETNGAEMVDFKINAATLRENK
jgi:hypothetical protein